MGCWKPEPDGLILYLSQFSGTEGNAPGDLCPGASESPSQREIVGREQTSLCEMILLNLAPSKMFQKSRVSMYS